MFYELFSSLLQLLKCSSTEVKVIALGVGHFLCKQQAAEPGSITDIIPDIPYDPLSLRGVISEWSAATPEHCWACTLPPTKKKTHKNLPINHEILKVPKQLF